MRRARRALMAVVLSACLLSAVPGLAATPTPGPGTASTTVTPSVIHGGAPPGERNPLEGALAVLAIVVVAAAGVFVYGVIRKGL